MENKSFVKKIVLGAFIAAEAGIYIAFNVIAATGGSDPVILKYCGILLCLAIACGMIYFCGRDALILSAALLFTAISDLFILVLNDDYETGVATFIIAQTIYLYRLYRGREGKVYITLAVRAVLIITVIAALSVSFGFDLLSSLAAVYFVMLCANCADAFVVCRHGIKNILFAVGLALFICCDVCVGLNNFGSVLDVDLPDSVLKFVSVAMWAFYLPSQVLIVCSVGMNAAGEERK